MRLMSWGKTNGKEYKVKGFFFFLSCSFQCLSLKIFLCYFCVVTLLEFLSTSLLACDDVMPLTIVSKSHASEKGSTLQVLAI